MNASMILGFGKSELQSEGGIITAREIAGQPDLWRKVYSEIEKNKVQLRNFLRINIKNGTKIILTGAGSSAFIGTSIQGSFSRNLHSSAIAIATTDLLTHPIDYINPSDHHLLVSFARSGDSPESMGVVELLNKICPDISHLIISCNKDGRLAQEITGENALSVILPTESNDQGLAMTGSFTSMMLAGLLISNISRLEDLRLLVETLSGYGETLLNEYLKSFKDIANKQFSRALFLGSGPLLGCATDSHLKLQELTAGKIICKSDSYLGLRHGPKVVINPETVVIALLSNNEHVNRYELDLLEDICSFTTAKTLIISESKRTEPFIHDQIFLTSDPERTIDEEFLPVCFVIPAQILGFYKALNLKLNPDAPAGKNVISRVVTGVTVYSYFN